MAYYRRIRELREDNDKTQKELAEYLGTPYQYYAVYEKGGAEISFERAIMLAKYYNVSLDYLAGITNCKQGMTKSDLTDEQRRVMELIKNMDNKQAEEFCTLLQNIINMMKK